jgi:hypothetical protein
MNPYRSHTDDDLRTTALERGSLMTCTTAAPRLTRWKATLALLIAATAVLAFAAGAGATVYHPTDGPGLQSAITSANSNAGADTIVLNDAPYQPTAPMTITDTLTITGDHANQATLGGPTVEGSFVVPTQADVFTINPGVSVSMVGFVMTTASDIGFAVVRDKGNLRFDNMSLSGNNGTQLGLTSGATATITNSSINDGNSQGISSQNGTLVLNNSTVANNASGGIAATGTLRLNNTIVAKNDPLAFGQKDCFAKATTQISSLDGDGTCGVTFSAKDPLLGPAINQGGPTPTLAPGPSSPAINAGDNSICPTADQRFFVHNDGLCDIGSYETGAPQDTTAPACAVTAVRSGPPKQQDVTATDGGSGLGADAVSNVLISNGAVNFTPFASPSRSGLVLTATKTDQTQITRWSFTAMDWAGNSKICQ